MKIAPEWARGTPFTSGTPRLDWPVAVDLERQQRSVGDEVSAFAVACDPAVPGHGRPHVHVLPGAARNPVDGAPVGECICPRAGRDVKSAIEKTVPELIGGLAERQDVDRIDRAQSGSDGHLLGAERGVENVAHPLVDRMDIAYQST